MRRRPPRYFHTLSDYQEMTVGDELHRVLAEDIDNRIIPGSVNHCPIAIDLWDDRPSGCMTRPKVLAANHRYDVSVWPEPGLRYDFCFYNDAVCQITELSDMGESVGGLNYGLRLKNIAEFEPPTAALRAHEKRAREVRTGEYHKLMQVWINSGRQGDPPAMPSHMVGGHHKMAQRLRAVQRKHLPHVDVHEEMLKRKEEEFEKREKARREREREKRDKRPPR